MENRQLKIENHDPMPSNDITQTLRVFCASVATLGLATSDEQGRPYAANVNFACDDALSFYFVSHPSSAHSRHIARQPLIAATTYAPFTEPAEIRGIQLRGACTAVPDAEFDRVWEVFLRKFPYAARFEQRARSERFYRVTPSWVRYIDNSVRFGFKWETDWPPQ